MSATKPRDNSSGADNEQGRLTEGELGWLAGILDGEGWMGLFGVRRHDRDYKRYSAALIVSTTSERITERMVSLLTKTGLKFYQREKPAYVASDGRPRLTQWEVSVRSNEATRALLRMLLPHLTEKKRLAELIIEYVDWRASYPHRPGGHAQNVVRGMRERAEETMRLLHEDRIRHTPSTTTRLAPVPKRRVMT